MIPAPSREETSGPPLNGVHLLYSGSVSQLFCTVVRQKLTQTLPIDQEEDDLRKCSTPHKNIFVIHGHTVDLQAQEREEVREARKRRKVMRRPVDMADDELEDCLEDIQTGSVGMFIIPVAIQLRSSDSYIVPLSGRTAPFSQVCLPHSYCKRLG
jgi:hypothetical protein